MLYSLRVFLSFSCCCSFCGDIYICWLSYNSIMGTYCVVVHALSGDQLRATTGISPAVVDASEIALRTSNVGARINTSTITCNAVQTVQIPYRHMQQYKLLRSGLFTVKAKPPGSGRVGPGNGDWTRPVSTRKSPDLTPPDPTQPGS